VEGDLWFAISRALTVGTHPVFLGIVNDSSKTILRYSFNFEAREPGRSTDVAYWDTYTDDKIIKPGEGWGTCWRVKSKDSTFNSDQFITDPKIEIRVINFRPTFE
jgi:hypothetical protein